MLPRAGDAGIAVNCFCAMEVPRIRLLALADLFDAVAEEILDEPLVLVRSNGEDAHDERQRDEERLPQTMHQRRNVRRD